MSPLSEHDDSGLFMRCAETWIVSRAGGPEKFRELLKMMQTSAHNHKLFHLTSIREQIVALFGLPCNASDFTLKVWNSSYLNSEGQIRLDFQNHACLDISLYDGSWALVKGGERKIEGWQPFSRLQPNLVDILGYIATGYWQYRPIQTPRRPTTVGLLPPYLSQNYQLEAQIALCLLGSADWREKNPRGFKLAGQTLSYLVQEGFVVFWNQSCQARIKEDLQRLEGLRFNASAIEDRLDEFLCEKPKFVGSWRKYLARVVDLVCGASEKDRLESHLEELRDSYLKEVYNLKDLEGKIGEATPVNDCGYLKLTKTGYRQYIDSVKTLLSHLNIRDLGLLRQKGLCRDMSPAEYTKQSDQVELDIPKLENLLGEVTKELKELKTLAMNVADSQTMEDLECRIQTKSHVSSEIVKELHHLYRKRQVLRSMSFACGRYWEAKTTCPEILALLNRD